MMCRSVPKIQEIEDTQEASGNATGYFQEYEEDYDAYHVEIDIGSVSQEKARWSVGVAVAGVNHTFRVDTGADVSPPEKRV